MLGTNSTTPSGRCVNRFRFASEGQSPSSRLLAERSPVCKPRLCRFGSNAVVMSRAAGSDEIHHSEQPTRRQFRFASERQSDSSRVLAERSAGCKHERRRFGSNAVAAIRASGSDDEEG